MIIGPSKTPILESSRADYPAVGKTKTCPFLSLSLPSSISSYPGFGGDLFLTVTFFPP